MVDEVNEFGRGITKYIRYTSNGEPLVHPKSYEMILYAVEKSATKITLTTNGSLLSNFSLVIQKNMWLIGVWIS